MKMLNNNSHSHLICLLKYILLTKYLVLLSILKPTKTKYFMSKMLTHGVNITPLFSKIVRNGQIERFFR